MKPSLRIIRHLSGHRLAALVLTICMTLSAAAATYSYRFDATPLNEAIARIIADHPEVRISFIFNELETYRTSAHINADDPYTALRQLVAFNPVRIVSHRGEYFVEAMQHGRYCYTGCVEAPDGEPVVAATVMALTPDDRTVITYGLTDSEGRFTIPCDRTSILLKISALGYRTDTITPTSFNLGNIRLATDAIALANVTVTARNISRVDDHLEIIPDKLSVKHAATGYQLLRNLMLPGMDVNPFEGKVTLFGQNVTLYINGEPAEYRMVQNLRPKDVEKIEYHDAPVGRYAGDFAAINFITKRQTTGGYVTLDGQQSIGGYLDGNYNGFSKINSKSTNYYVFAGYNMKNSVALQLDKSEKFYLSSRSIDRTFNSLGGRDRYYGEYC